MDFWTPQELLNVLREAKKNSSRDFCLILLAYRHGLRREEISRLTLDDVRNGHINVQRLKGSLHTIQPLYSDSNPLLDEHKALAAWLEDRGDADGSIFLFTSRQGSALKARQIYNVFENAAFAAGLAPGRRNPHQAKHALGSHAIRAGVSVAHLQQLLGHKDPKATLFYTHITQSEAAQAATKAMTGIFS